jgi:hypothetical protein
VLCILYVHRWVPTLKGPLLLSTPPFMGGGGRRRGEGEGGEGEAVKSRQISLQALITESACLGPHTHEGAEIF